MAVGLHEGAERVLERAEGLRVDVDAEHAHDLAVVIADEVRGALQRAAVGGGGDVVAHVVVVRVGDLLGHLEGKARGGRPHRAARNVGVHDLHEAVLGVGEVMQGDLGRRAEGSAEKVDERDERGYLLVHAWLLHRRCAAAGGMPREHRAHPTWRDACRTKSYTVAERRPADGPRTRANLGAAADGRLPGRPRTRPPHAGKPGASVSFWII